MKPLLMLPALLLPAELMASCFNNPDVVVFGQMSYTHKKPSLWRIDNKNPYAGDNSFGDLVVKYDDRCELIDNKLSVDASLYGLANYPVRDTGAFEKDKNRMRVLLDRFRVSYNATDSVRFDIGKLRAKEGLFYLKSPASLLTNYYSGFKTSRINSPALKQSYYASFWGAVLAHDTLTHSLALTVAPKLTRIKKRYESSGNWSATARSNASERYLLSWTDYRFDKNVPTLSLMLGDSPSAAFSNSYNLTQQFVINGEVAWHRRQQWRHLDADKVRLAQNYAFPTELYSTQDKDGVELALGFQYTTDRFSQFGMEYYYQSEGYSSSQWRQQADAIKFFNQRTQYAPIDNAFDAYKYLMASEIYNTSARGQLMGKHYISGWASLLLADESTVQPYAVLNMRDHSAMLGLHYNKPIERLDKKLDVYTGVYSALGASDSEFGLFGETLGTYLGIKYHF